MDIDFPEGDFSEPPRSLPENCVEYLLFVLDSKNEAHSSLSYLEDIRRAAIRLCDSVTEGYIWQRDSFQLGLERDQDLIYLRGATDYGDSVEDEWLIVYLLRELTKSFPMLWVRIFDSDGEFLLVEAASVLPKWLSPEMDGNRAWIHDGKLYMLPLTASSRMERPLSLSEAVEFIKTNPDALVHSIFVEAEAFYRLEKYPKHVTDTIHHSLVTIPRKLAWILHEKPSTIAPAVEAFYLRDPVAMKSLISPSKDLHFPPGDLVTVSVKFTRILFAQLKSQRFLAPPMWRAMLEAAEKEAAGAEDAKKTLARLEMGMKMASGFEMLATNTAKKENRLAREFAMILEDIEEEGTQAFPAEEDMGKWENAYRDDDETWLDINFEQFENELEGKHRPQERPGDGFGDSSAQANLRKIVSRFEAFLNDEKAGIDGAEMEDTDEGDDVSDETEEGSDDEDKAVSFDEEQFSRMMREMMGLPPAQHGDSKSRPEHPSNVNTRDVAEEEDEEIRQLAAQMEAELKEYGALRLDPGSEQHDAARAEKGTVSRIKTKGGSQQKADNGEESSEGEVDVDYNLAKNLLESFKSQAGMAGPAGNILGMMGLQLPRDEDEEDD